MVQTVKSPILSSGQQMMFFEKPHALLRIFIKITALLPLTGSYETKISFDDPSFCDFYALLGPTLYFEAKGDGIFQGDVWVRNVSNISIFYTATEILV